MTQALETKFNFKARKITDENGKEIGKTKKQPSLTVSLPVPTVDEIVAALQLPDVEVPPKKEGEEPTKETPKVKALLLDAIYDIIRTQAKSQLDDAIDNFGTDESKQISVEYLDYDKLNLQYIADLPPAQRGARAIPEEDWEAFFMDYMQVMVQVTGKPEDKIKNHVELFKKPTRIKQNKDALALLVENLDIYLASSASLDDTGDCASRVRGKFDKWLKEDSKVDLSAL